RRSSDLICLSPFLRTTILTSLEYNLLSIPINLFNLIRGKVFPPYNIVSCPCTLFISLMLTLPISDIELKGIANIPSSNPINKTSIIDTIDGTLTFIRVLCKLAVTFSKSPIISSISPLFNILLESFILSFMVINSCTKLDKSSNLLISTFTASLDLFTTSFFSLYNSFDATFFFLPFLELSVSILTFLFGLLGRIFTSSTSTMFNNSFSISFSLYFVIISILNSRLNFSFSISSAEGLEDIILENFFTVFKITKVIAYFSIQSSFTLLDILYLFNSFFL